MTTEEKANEICKRHIFDSNHYDCCMEMAKWKEQQMIDKACEWLKNNTITVTNDTCTYTASSHNISKEDFIVNFKKVMEKMLLKCSEP